jgi:hypothetical protein
MGLIFGVPGAGDEVDSRNFIKNSWVSIIERSCVSRKVVVFISCGAISIMAEDIDPTKALLTAREKLTEERRALAVTIALGYRRRHTDDPQSNESRMAFINVQNLIEAIDRAIAQEKLMVREQPSTSPVSPQSAHYS